MKKFNLKCINWIQSSFILILCQSYLISCTTVKDKEEPIVQEVIKTNKIMIYKFYKAKSAGLFQGEQMVKYIQEFDKIYAENDVEVIGTWYNADDPSETYFMTGFKSEQHYSDFVEKMKTHDDYQRMSKEMEPDRLSIEAVTLKSYNGN